MAQAIGIAGALTPIVNMKISVSNSDMYHYQHGLTCRDGIVSALIAKSGITCLEEMLDGDTGYWVTISDTCQWDWMTKGLGKDYLIMEILFKHWPANMWVQQYLDIVDAIAKEEKLRADDVAEIIVSPSYHKVRSRMVYRPEGYLGITDAQFSIPYCTAAYLLDPEPGPNWFTDDKLKDKRILKLAGRVKATGPEMTPNTAFRMFQEGKYPEASVEIATNDGRHPTKSLPFPKGHLRNRLTENEFKERFRRTASFVLPPDKIEKAIEKIFKLEEVKDVSEITDLMHP